MMRFLLIIFTVSPLLSMGQRTYIRLGVERNIDIWKPYSEFGEYYQDSTGNISSSTWGIELQSDILVRSRWVLGASISYKKINFRVKDRIHTWNYSYSYFNSGTWYHFDETRKFEDPADLVANSNSVGFTTEFAYKLNLKSTPSATHSIGISPKIYFLEFYNSHYESNDFSSDDVNESIPKPAPNPRKRLMFSSMNSNLFYRVTWYMNESLSLGAKVNIGMNLYSDWAEFNRYGYIGVGLELGFGQFKLDQKKNEPNNSNE